MDKLSVSEFAKAVAAHHNVDHVEAVETVRRRAQMGFADRVERLLVVAIHPVDDGSGIVWSTAPDAFKVEIDYHGCITDVTVDPQCPFWAGKAITETVGG